MSDEGARRTEAESRPYPLRFSEIIGHVRVVQWLARIASEGRGPGAYLLYGPEGAGKTSLASAFVAALACRRRSAQGEACGVCEACRAVAAGRHPDVTWVEPAADADGIGIDQVRRLRNWLGMSATSDWGKAAIIQQADRMSLQAANALLKTLEEPPGPAAIVLLARDLQAIPETIQSRCQRFFVGPVPAPVLARALASRLGLDDDEAHTRAVLAGGLPGRALDPSGSAVAAWRQRAMEWIEQAVQGSPRELIGLARDAERAGPHEVDAQFQAMIWLWRDVAAWGWVRRADCLIDLGLSDRVVAVGRQVDPARAVDALETLLTARRMLAEYTHPRLVLHWAWMTLRRARAGPASRAGRPMRSA